MRPMVSLGLCLFLVSLVGGEELPQGHTAASHETDARSYDRFVESKLKHTYPATAMRMLRECGNVESGICIDIGCGTGRLDIELARRSKLQIIGLDINPDMQPFFDKHVRDAGFADRIRFIQGDAQQLPFPDDYADVIVSRGALIFIPDLAKCLQEVSRVLKPSGVAFLGGRYLYAPDENKMSIQSLQQIVRDAGVPNAHVIDGRGQWVKILGAKAPEAARSPEPGPAMFAARCLADYQAEQGDCLLVCGSDGPMVQALQQGFLDLTELTMTALYPSEQVANEARARIKAAEQEDRITCRFGKIDQLPFPGESFDLVAGVGPVLIWSDRQAAMRELYRVLRPKGAALIGGRYLQMPDARKVSSEQLRDDARATGIRSIQVLDDHGQWVEIRRE